ncbi:MAG: MBL fold metallo-hydrolase [Oscillospiraceae bacterium]|nr:MBL fold metallo-hydrolase [Oscillospiraceae bacterium]
MKNRKIKFLLCVVQTAIILCFGACSSFDHTSTLPQISQSDAAGSLQEPVGTDNVKIFFLKTKDDADCIVLQSSAGVIMIDTAEEQDVSFITAWLNSEKIQQIDCLILTHPDKDHIGGAVQLVDQFTVKQVIEPKYDGEKEQLTILNNVLESKRIPVLYPTQPYDFTLGEIKITIYPPEQQSYSGENNYSLVTLVRHGSVNMLFAGDAEKKRLAELLQQQWPAINLLKAPYHGRLTGNSVAFIEQIAPQYAVITALQADEEIKAAYEKQGTDLYYSCLNTVVFISDGENITNLS